jgi:cell division protein FtsL
MNRIVTEEETTPEKEVDQGSRNFTETVKRFADFDFRINPTQVIKQLPFLIYVCVLVMLFIYNSHRSEKLIRETDKLNREIKDLRSEYISELSELMSESKQSSVAVKMKPYGIKELKTPPSKITYSGKQ